MSKINDGGAAGTSRTSYQVPTASWPRDKLDAWLGWNDWLDEAEIKPEWLAEFKEIAHRDIAHRDNEAAKLARFYLDAEVAWRWHFADAMIAAKGDN